MSKLIRRVMTLIILLISGCGIDSVTFTTQPETNPVIIAYRFTQNVAALTIDGSVDFEAPVYDLVSMTRTITDSKGTAVYFDQPALNYPGMRTGTVPFSISYSPFAPGTFTLKIELVDSAGRFSNAVFYTFTK